MFVSWLTAPLERYIANYLRVELAKYVYNIDLKDFSLSGEDTVVIRDLDLKLGIIICFFCYRGQ